MWKIAWSRSQHEGQWLLVTKSVLHGARHPHLKFLPTCLVLPRSLLVNPVHKRKWTNTYGDWSQERYGKKKESRIQDFYCVANARRRFNYIGRFEKGWWSPCYTNRVGDGGQSFSESILNLTQPIDDISHALNHLPLWTKMRLLLYEMERSPSTQGQTHVLGTWGVHPSGI